MKNIEYAGIPLKDFCEKYNINYQSVLRKIERLKATEIYLGYTDNDYARMAMEEEVLVKYKIYGTSLFQYCKNNGISYYSIIGKIKRLLENDRYKDFDMSALVELAMCDNYIGRNIMYVYQNQPLKSYCKKKGINYRTVLTRINVLKQKEEYKDYSLEKIIEMAVSKDYILSKTYLYNGVSLFRYCKENKISYSSIVNKVFKLKNKEKYKNTDPNELVKMIMETRERKN